MPVTKIRLGNFTAFKDLEVEFSPDINALVGANEMGKTHLNEARVYAAYDVSKTGDDLMSSLNAHVLAFESPFVPTGYAGLGIRSGGSDPGLQRQAGFGQKVR